MLKRTALHGYALFNKSLGGAEVKKMVAKIFQRQRWFKKILTELLEKLLKFL
jgi:hypothetical protein